MVEALPTMQVKAAERRVSDGGKDAVGEGLWGTTLDIQNIADACGAECVARVNEKMCVI